MAWWLNGDETTQRWVYLPVSDDRLLEIGKGNLAPRTALETPEDGHIYVVDLSSATNELQQVSQTNVRFMQEASLPSPDATVTLPNIELVLASLGRTDRLHLLQVSLEEPSYEAGSIGARSLGRFVSTFQNLLDAVSQSVEGIATSRAPIPTWLLASTELEVIASRRGSFSIVMQADPDRSDVELLDRSLSSLLDLFAPASAEGAPGLLLPARAFESRIRRHYSELLALVHAHLDSVSIAWSSPLEPVVRQVELLPDLAGAILEALDESPESKRSLLTARGRLVMLNLRTNRFRLDALEGMSFTGDIVPALARTLIGYRVGVRYTVELQVDTHFPRAVGGPPTDYYTLTRITPEA